MFNYDKTETFTVAVWIDPADLADAAPGTYTGYMKYNSLWCSRGEDPMNVAEGSTVPGVSGEIALTLTVEPESQPTVVSHAMTLSSEIGVEYKISFPASVNMDNVRVEFNLSDGRKNVVTSGVQDGENTYWFTCNINAMELAETITPTLYINDVATTLNNSGAYSAMMYINAQKDSDDATLATLVKALQDYGYYMQQSVWQDNIKPN